MNTRQQLYKKYRLEGYSKYTSARKAGYSHSYATQAKNIEKRIDMTYWLEKAGLTDTALAKHAEQGMNAMRIISANITYGEANGKTTDFIEVPDWSSRHKYYDTILKLNRYLSDKGIDLSKHINITKIQVNVSDDTQIPLTQESRNGISSKG